MGDKVVDLNPDHYPSRGDKVVNGVSEVGVYRWFITVRGVGVVVMTTTSPFEEKTMPIPLACAVLSRAEIGWYPE